MKFTIFKDNGDLLSPVEYHAYLAMERFKVLEALGRNIYKSPYTTIIRNIHE